MSHEFDNLPDIISLGATQRVLRVLGLEADFDLLARDDAMGRKLQDMALPGPRRRRQAKARDGA